MFIEQEWNLINRSNVQAKQTQTENWKRGRECGGVNAHLMW